MTIWVWYDERITMEIAALRLGPTKTITAVSQEVSASKESPKAFVHRQILIGNKAMIQKSLKRYWKWQRQTQGDELVVEAEKIFNS